MFNMIFSTVDVAQEMLKANVFDKQIIPSTETVQVG